MRHKSHKRERVQKEGTLTFKNGVCLTTLKELRAHSDGKKVKKRAHVKVDKPSQRRCRRCSKTGQNVRACKKDTEGTVNSSVLV
jgi:hypothetical protein